MKILGLNGRLIQEYRVREGVEQIDLPQTKGFYLVQLQQRDYVVTEKVVIE